MKHITNINRWQRTVLVFGAGALAAVLTFTLTSSVAKGAVPQLINFQGVLKNGSGQPVTDGSYSVTFKIYDAAVGGNMLWTETQSVTTTNGLFTALLGSTNAVPDSAFKDSSRWLGISVPPDAEMTPRQQLVSASYGYRVNSVDGAAGGTITGGINVNTGSIAFESGYGLYWPNACIYGGGPTLEITSTDYIIFRTGGICSGSARMFLDGTTGRFGIGTLSPSEMLQVAGTIHSTSGGFKFPDGTIQTTAAGGGAFLPLTGGTMTGPIANTGDPAITMGKGNFGSENNNDGTQAFVAGRNNRAHGAYSVVSGGGGATAADSNAASGLAATVAGGRGNLASGDYATAAGYYNTASNGGAHVGGGGNNTASGLNSTVGGGDSDTASNEAATVSGGYQNRATAFAATVTGGGGNLSSGDYAVAGGFFNTASSAGAHVGGGGTNTASGFNSSVSGGGFNRARGAYSVVGGGGGATAADSNSALGSNSFIGGGFRNIAGGSSSTISGGSGNTASNNWATVGGGSSNTASNLAATIGGGAFNAASEFYTTIGGGRADTASGNGATIAGGHSNKASAFGSSIGGGQYNHAHGVYSVVSGGGGAAATDSNSAVGDNSAIGGGKANKANGILSTISGGNANTAGATNSTVGGGSLNTAGGPFSTVSGGGQNSASGQSAVIGGGTANTAGAQDATVGGGNTNTASAAFATIGGGLGDTASGFAATIPGGSGNKAVGDYSFAAGRHSKALHSGAFVWADGTLADFASTGADQFLIRASGGVGIGTSSPGAMLDVNGSLKVGGGTVISKIQFGSIGDGTPNSTGISGSVTFPTAFSSTPLVFLQIQELDDNGSTSVRITAVSATGFSWNAWQGTLSSSADRITWMAIGP